MKETFAGVDCHIDFKWFKNTDKFTIQNDVKKIIQCHGLVNDICCTVCDIIEQAYPGCDIDKMLEPILEPFDKAKDKLLDIIRELLYEDLSIIHT